MCQSNEFEQLITNEDIKLKLRKTRLDYDEISIDKQYEKKYNNWNLIRRNKNTLRIRKEKKDDIRFKDKVWSLFAGLDFKYMNANRNFRIKYAENIPGKQIDVFAVDDQVVLIIECKSTSSPEKATFEKDINEINGIRQNIINRIKKHFEGTPKFAWIFCTNNYMVSDNNIAHMKEHGITYFNQNDIDYYNSLVKEIGTAAKYQLFGRLFAKQDIPKLNNIVPAVKGKMGGYTYYSFAIEPELLLKISYIVHRVQTTEESLHAYQRMVKRNRIKQIGEFIDNGNFFPNAIIINIDTKNGRDLNFDYQKPNNSHSSNSQLGLLHLPKYFRSAYVIDGQHRLYGYSESKYKNTNTIPVIAFENLPSEVQSNLFVDINSKQKSVNRNLLSTLDAELRWNSPNKDDAIKALKSKLVQILTERIDSPLYDRIIIGEAKKNSTKCITLAYFCDYGLNKCKFFGELQKKKLIKIGYLCDGDNLAEQTLKKAYTFFKKCFQLAADKLPTQWQQGELEGGFIAKNIGVSSYVVIINDIFEYIEKKSNIIFSGLPAEDLFDYAEPFLQIILNKLENLPKADLANMTKQYGAGGVEKVRREFQIWLNKVEPDFNPLGLEKYIQDNSGIFNKETRNTIIALQEKINDFIISKLKNEYGDNWWVTGVPHKIQKECASKHIDEGRKEQEWNYLLLLDYKEIIKSRWSLLGNYFTPPGGEQMSKDKKIDWFLQLNKIRNKVMHPERESIKSEEHKFVMNLNEWLSSRLDRN